MSKLQMVVVAVMCWAVWAGYAASAWADDKTQRSPIPAANAADLKKGPEPPGAEPSMARARLLVQAIRENKPDVARPFFFPQEAFRQVKSIPKPDRYWKRLMTIYLDDVRDLRKKLKGPDSIEFVGFEIDKAKKKWQPRGAEGNNYPYWAMYKAWLVVKDAGQVKKLKLRVMINWGDQWYITHLTRMP
ncbi:MAG: hypothetical protein AAFX99_36695 [Myxococcota bacterium]